MIIKLKIVEQEADETVYWLELLVEGRKTPRDTVLSLIRESNEILAMTVSSIQTLRIRSSRN